MSGRTMQVCTTVSGKGIDCLRKWVNGKALEAVDDGLTTAIVFFDATPVLELRDEGSCSRIKPELWRPGGLASIHSPTKVETILR